MSLGFGTQARVGQLYPSGGQCDYELQLMAPVGLQFLTTRMPFRATGVADDLAIVRDLEQNSRLLGDAEVDLIAFNCTAASMMVGPDVIRKRIHDSTGIPSITTIEAVEQALHSLGAERIALLNPYPAEVESREIDYLQRRGFQVIATGGPACRTPVEQGRIAPTEWLRFAGNLDLANSDTLLVSCAGTQTAQVIDAIENNIGRPVVTSNQALLWLILMTLGIESSVLGYGRLLSTSHRPK